MAGKRFPKLDRRVLNVRPDVPDIRDRFYTPSLMRLARDRIAPKIPARRVIDQGNEGSCTGCALAGLIDYLNELRGFGHRVSPRMLYEMAKRHDEWPGEEDEGSSLRGAIRGWHAMGVCSDEKWPYISGEPEGHLSLARARDARMNTLGAYYRLRPILSDYHAALNDVEAIYVSAKIHSGWMGKAVNDGKINRKGQARGGHAFAIVGYDAAGFYVLNSWGPKWARRGIAHWLYEDWLENVMDAWVLRLALPVPTVFGLRPKSSIVTQDTADGRAEAPPPRRSEIAGHFVHFKDGHFAERDDYWSDENDVKVTAENLKGNRSFGHLMIYAHGGLNSPAASAKRIRALKDGFIRNRIYPLHMMYDTGLGQTVADVVRGALGLASARVGALADITDTLIERLVRKPGTLLWDEMKDDARRPFEGDGDGLPTLAAFARALSGSSITLHLVGHSTGAILLGHLLDALDTVETPVSIGSCNLMAPACTVDFFDTHFRPRLSASGGAADSRVRLPHVTVYRLTDKLEQSDQVAKAYRKSLLYLVSRAFERDKKEKPLLGMAMHHGAIGKIPQALRLVKSDGDGRRSASTSHGGFDNDPATMNDILAGILGKPAKRENEFTKEELAY